MAFLKVLLFLLVSVLGLSHGSYVDTLNKCSLKDNGCHRNLIQKLMKDIAPTGIPEIDLPPIDPMHVKHINASILNVVDLILNDVKVKGVKNCVIDSSDVNVEHMHASIQLTCDITIKGKYNVKSSSPVVKSLLGDEIHGEGNCKVKIEKITIKIEFHFVAVKRGDDVFLTCQSDTFKYTFKINGKVTFYVDSIYLGDREASKEILPLMNDGWKFIIDSFGKHFIDIAFNNYVYDFLNKFFSNVSAKYYLTDDLSSLV